MRFYLLFIICISVTYLLAGQAKSNNVEKIKLVGHVYDAVSKKPITFAHISVKGKSYGTISNQDGFFELYVPVNLKNNEICISYMGYISECRLIEKIVNLIEIELKKETKILGEVSVKPIDAKSIIKKALNKIPVNYNPAPEVLSAFYRETIKDSSQYFFHSEAVIDIYKTPCQTDEKDEIRLVKGRKLNPKYDTRLSKLFNVEGGPYFSVEADIVKNPVSFINKKELFRYSYSLSNTLNYNGRQTYIIEFDQKKWVKRPYYKGKIYIDTETLAFVGFDFGFSPKGMAYAKDLFVRKEEHNVATEFQNANFKVKYKHYDDLFHLFYTSSDIQLSASDKEKGIASVIKLETELLVSSKHEEIFAQKFEKDELFSSIDVLTHQIKGKYDTQFWDNYNILQPGHSIVEGITNTNRLDIEVWDLKELFLKYNRKFIGEKVFVHTDKNKYKAGGTVWFKAWAVNSNTHKPSTKSTSLEVTLIDDHKNIISNHTFSLKKGCAYGDFKLRDTLPDGIYQLIAKSDWMKNFSANEYFIKKIEIETPKPEKLFLKLTFNDTIFKAGDEVQFEALTHTFQEKAVGNTLLKYELKDTNKLIHTEKVKLRKGGKRIFKFKIPDNSSEDFLSLEFLASKERDYVKRLIYLPLKQEKISIQFFPESGELLSGVNNRVAFKAVNEFGKGVDFKAKLIKNDTIIIDTIKPVHNGMGWFWIKAEKKDKYHIEILNHNLTPKFNLPKAIDEGVILQLKHVTDNEIIIQVIGNVQEAAKKMYATVMMHGELLFATKNLSDSSLITVPLKKLSAGIARITLFKANKIPVAERLVFVNKNKIKKPEIAINQKTFSTKDTVNLTVNIDSVKNQNIAPNLSLAVVNTDKLNVKGGSSACILSSFLLTSELKGRIESPGDYFQYNNKKSNRLLDLIMLTHGWRRFRLENVLTLNIDSLPAPQKSDFIYGKITDIKDKPLDKANVTVTNLDTYEILADTVTNSEGIFAIEKYLFADTMQIALVGTSRRGDNNVKINLIANRDSISDAKLPEIPQPEYVSIKSAVKSDNERKEIEEYDKMIREVTVTANRTIKTYKSKWLKTFANAAVLAKTGKELRTSARFIDLVRQIAPPERIDYESRQIYYRTHQHRKNAFFPDYSLAAAINKAEGGSGSVVPKDVANAFGTDEDGIPKNPDMAGNLKIGVLFVLNDIPIGHDYSPLENLKKEDIKSITILKGPQANLYFGARANGGVIFVETYAFTDIYKLPIKKAENIIMPRVYKPVREFYQPPENDENTPDFRTTLLWVPCVKFDLKNRFTESFINSDLKGEKTIIIQGVDNMGNLYYNETNYLVK